MRSLVFLPPPKLSHFAHGEDSDRCYDRLQFSANPRTPAAANIATILCDETRISATLHDNSSTCSIDRVAREPLILANESRIIPNHENDVQEVPDSVDPHLHPPYTEVEESLPQSIVPDAPAQVPWELLHGIAGADVDQPRTNRISVRQGTGTGRMAKRVRIRSPVVVIETPERAPPFLTRILGGGKQIHRPEEEEEEEGEGDVDTSRVFVGEDVGAADQTPEDDLNDVSRVNLAVDDESDGDAEQSKFSIPVRSVLAGLPSVSPSTGLVRNAELHHQTNTSVIDHSNDVESQPRDIHDSRVGQTFDDSLLAPCLPAIGPTIADVSDASFRGERGEGDGSASSLQIRAPIPATTCRFTFFSKRPRGSTSLAANTTTATTTAGELTSFVLHPPSSGPSQESRVPTSANASITPSMPAAEASNQNPAQQDLRQTLPTFNDRNASLPTFLLPPSSISQSNSNSTEDSMATHSIIPPPTLHFNLSSVTPVSRILAHPMHFLSAPRPRFGTDAAGAASSRVNLLVVVKEVGEVSRVRCKFPVDKPTTKLPVLDTAGRAETRRGVSKAFKDALEHQGEEAEHGDGKTERVELIVMDGHMSTIRRLREGSTSSGEWKVVTEQEVGEKVFFKIVVWGRLAREWTESLPQRGMVGDDGSILNDTRGDGLGEWQSKSNATSAFASVSVSTTPTALRPGDVVSLTNLNLTRSSSTTTSNDTSFIAQKRPRLGPGFPRLPTTIEKPTLIANASHFNNTNIELCYRSYIINNPIDKARNFDPAVAAFDLKSRRVLELSTLWKYSSRYQ
ncbi:uncharacterized protein UTRI_04585_B [Ustilago trichophora]|uniref:Uncharacterized protein n=1 Tax=Ustilago trichophora TaxID=86804 RepID=A0A5C3EEU0_9BASI|nr:uncharacterized protein UTRI_04585_B [Ustilago trichophora]